MNPRRILWVRQSNSTAAGFVAGRNLGSKLLLLVDRHMLQSHLWLSDADAIVSDMLVKGHHDEDHDITNHSVMVWSSSSWTFLSTCLPWMNSAACHMTLKRIYAIFLAPDATRHFHGTTWSVCFPAAANLRWNSSVSASVKSTLEHATRRWLALHCASRCTTTVVPGQLAGTLLAIGRFLQLT